MNAIAIVELVSEIIGVIKEMKDAGLFDDAIQFYQNSQKAQDLVSKAQAVVNSIPKPSSP
jgi:hypothetical protein